MKPAVHTLTYDQAVDELAAIFDARPADDQVIELHHWKEENAQRAVDLEAWILMKTPKQATQADPIPKKDVAPPHHLPEPPVSRPEPAKALPAKRQKAGIPLKTPTEKLRTLQAKYEQDLVRVKADPSNRKLRCAASTTRSHIKTLCQQFHVHMPTLEPMPALPDPKKPGGAKKEKPAPVPKVEEAHPYEPPTLQDLGITTAARAREVSEALMDAQLAASPGPAFSKDVALGQALHVRAALRGIRRDLLHVIPQIEDLDDQGRNVIEEDLDVLDNLVCAALSMAREAGIHQAG